MSAPPATSTLPHHDGTITQHAFATLFERPDGTLGLVWLDWRLTVKDREKGPMTIRYGAYDAQWKQISDRALDAKVCDCCTTSVARPTSTTRRPVAKGSSVPVCPTARVPSSRRTRWTTSWEVSPAGLSTSSAPIRWAPPA